MATEQHEKLSNGELIEIIKLEIKPYFYYDFLDMCAEMTHKDLVEILNSHMCEPCVSMSQTLQ